jgi:hypothetical protein
VLLGGGLVVALAAGAAGAGYWVLAAVILAAVLAGATTRVPALGDTRAEHAAVAFARVAMIAVYAIAFGSYVVPAQAKLAAAAFVVAVVAAGAFGLRVPGFLAGILTVVLLLAAAALIALCMAVAPVTTMLGVRAPNVSAVVLAVLMIFPFLRPALRTQQAWRVLALGSVAVFVTFAALYQLGPLRLGLSVTSMRDLLSAADADTLQPLLTVVVVLATVPAALSVFADVRARLGRAGSAGAGVVAAVAVLLGPAAVLLAAGLGTVIELLLGVRNRRYSGVRE